MRKKAETDVSGHITYENLRLQSHDGTTTAVHGVHRMQHYGRPSFQYVLLAWGVRTFSNALNESAVEHVAHTPFPQTREERLAQQLDIAPRVGCGREEMRERELKLRQHGLQVLVQGVRKTVSAASRMEHDMMKP